MDFFDMVQKLQLIYGMKIILISCGSFYIAIGTDAVVLNKELGLKLNCAKRGLCKVGIPKGSLEKYKQKLDELGYSYIVLDYGKDKNQIIKICEVQGTKERKYEDDCNIECNTCQRRRYFVKTEYESTLEEFLKLEFGEDFV